MLCFFYALPATMLPTLRGDHLFGLGIPFFQQLCGGNARTLSFLNISDVFTYLLIVYCARAALAVTPLLGLMACVSTCLNKTLYLDTPVAWIVPSLAWSLRV